MNGIIGIGIRGWRDLFGDTRVVFRTALVGGCFKLASC
jgi:hypothetical protein